MNVFLTVAVVCCYKIRVLPFIKFMLIGFFLPPRQKHILMIQLCDCRLKSTQPPACSGFVDEAKHPV